MLRFRHGRGPGAYHAFLNHAVVDAIRSGSCDTSTEIEPAASSRSYSRRVRTNGIETTSSTVSAVRQCNEKTGGYCDPFERVRLRISPVLVYLANFQIRFHRDSHEKILLYIFDLFCRPFAPIQSWIIKNRQYFIENFSNWNSTEILFYTIESSFLIELLSRKLYRNYRNTIYYCTYECEIN